MRAGRSAAISLERTLAIRSNKPPGINPLVIVGVVHARSPWARLVGLLGERRLPAGCGLLLSACMAVHTLGMRRPIDVVFLDVFGQVLSVERHVASGRVLWCPRSSAVIEFAAGDAWRLGLHEGSRVLMMEVKA